MFEDKMVARNWMVHGSLAVETVREILSAKTHEFSWEIAHVFNSTIWKYCWREGDLFDENHENWILRSGIMDDFGELWEMDFTKHPSIDHWKEHSYRTFDHSQVCIEGVYMDAHDPHHRGWLGKIKRDAGSYYYEDPLPFSLPKETGWDTFAELATMDGMLCVRWLNWYEIPPCQIKGTWYPSWHGQVLASRQALHEGVIGANQREVAAEIFPMEIGSLQAQYFYDSARISRKSSIGLVLDLHQSEVREIYSSDCWSYNEGRNLKTNHDGRWKTTSLAEARLAYERIGMRRLNRRHTECFVSKSVPAALVVYGAREQSDLSQLDQILVRRLSKRLPVIFMQPTVEGM